MKIEQILTRDERHTSSLVNGTVRFENVGAWTSLDVYVPDWRDMGRPETITVTVQPGDLLNSEPRSDHPELDLG